MKLASSVSSGFFFQCTQCGICCSNEQEGYVFVYGADIFKMSRKLHLTLAEFAKHFLLIIPYDYKIWDENLEDTQKTRSFDTLVLNYQQTQNCLFLNDDKGCDLYHDRPLQCKLFPFWNMIMTSEPRFQSILEGCEGDFSNNQSSEYYYTPDQIRALVNQERQAEFDYYQEMKKKDFDIYRVYPFLEQTKRLHLKIYSPNSPSN